MTDWVNNNNHHHQEDLALWLLEQQQKKKIKARDTFSNQQTTGHVNSINYRCSIFLSHATFLYSFSQSHMWGSFQITI